MLEDRSGYADHKGARLRTAAVVANSVERYSQRSRLLRAGSRPSRPQGTASQFDPNWTSTSKIGHIKWQNDRPNRQGSRKLGDFDGIDKNGVPQRLLFPASPAFSLDRRSLYVANLALDFQLGVSPDVQAIDSQWTDQVKSYTVSKTSTNFKPLGQGH